MRRTEALRARAAARASVIPTGTWTVDPARSTVAFRLRHLMVVPVRGRFDTFEGTVAVEPGGRTHARGCVKVATLDTGDAVRDERLRGPEFFDVQNSPEISFASTSVESLDDESLRIAGELTIGQITRELVLLARQKAARPESIELDVSGELSRREFGIESPQLLDAGISDKVELALAISLHKDG
ncbi:MAG TPA: YceI family protein [Solirubrobacteraceae bacterium]|nr:YceI family protein [Solirubrobacteraceae bacterium]